MECEKSTLHFRFDTIVFGIGIRLIFEMDTYFIRTLSHFPYYTHPQMWIGITQLFWFHVIDVYKSNIFSLRCYEWHLFHIFIFSMRFFSPFYVSHLFLYNSLSLSIPFCSGMFQEVQNNKVCMRFFIFPFFTFITIFADSISGIFVCSSCYFFFNSVQCKIVRKQNMKMERKKIM